jgi:hypothetical protein
MLLTFRGIFLSIVGTLFVLGKPPSALLPYLGVPKGLPKSALEALGGAYIGWGAGKLGASKSNKPKEYMKIYSIPNGILIGVDLLCGKYRAAAF